MPHSAVSSERNVVLFATVFDKRPEMEIASYGEAHE